MREHERDDDPDREAIVRRRSRLVALALTGIVTGAAQACACLRYAPEREDAAVDAGPDASDSDAGQPDR